MADRNGALRQLLPGPRELAVEPAGLARQVERRQDGDQEQEADAPGCQPGAREPGEQAEPHHAGRGLARGNGAQAEAQRLRGLQAVEALRAGEGVLLEARRLVRRELAQEIALGDLLSIDQRVVHSALSEPERSGPLLYGATRSPILSARALEQLAEALARPEQHPIEVEARKPEVGADPFLVLLGDVEAEQQLAVAVGAQLADQAPHLLDLLLAHEGGELAGRGIGGIDGRRVDRVPLAAPRALAVAAEEHVASGAEEEAREPARLGDRAAAQPL